ncbi:MAG: putative protein-disulfide isomerase [Planctomycetota bacterium]|jgi:putative protein-disulfide isomerase
MTTANLYYVGDPMCSWCFAFQPTIDAIRSELSDKVKLCYVMGGLAPDSDVHMPEETQCYVQENWRVIEAQTPTRFNWDFWTKCKPRRSTYPSCRAVIAAGLQDETLTPLMFKGIQNAYYREAMNPSDLDTLLEVASKVEHPVDLEKLKEDMASEKVEALLQENFVLRRRIKGGGFPSLILEINGMIVPIQEGWGQTAEVIEKLRVGLKPQG